MVRSAEPQQMGRGADDDGNFIFAQPRVRDCCGSVSYPTLISELQ